ncbi:pentatricopeptide repeat-containing protein At3g49170, chloroplastic-like [Vicia villosa]|uniref:pentatricopeptide repeat-containing protein At3g49170, chloroplastic-like n=1 Tax=Vicia villosa TaxID=3911 RepID=UPI00273BAB99|nr:pentatricopeptide repeat-containing protein At3g49170, chloroplastic-like [Vicia villosa]
MPIPSINLSLPLPSHLNLKNPNSSSSSHKQQNFNNLTPSQLHKAISTLNLSPTEPSHNNLITSSLLLKACIRTNNSHLGKLLHHKLTHSHLPLDSVLLNSLISLYSKSGDTQTALSIFQTMDSTQRDIVSYSSMISCYANNGNPLKAVNMFVELLHQDGIFPNEYCFTAAIRACGCSNSRFFETGLSLFGFVLKTGYFDSHVCVGCELIDMFVKGGGGDLDSARKVFERMRERNVVTWTLMITRLAQFGYHNDAIELFLDMLVNSGYLPDRFTLTGLISVCAEIEFLRFGKELHSWVIRSGLASDLCVGCSLVDMYAKCGLIRDSRRVFDRMADHNVMSWTAVINGYVRGGGGREWEALRLFSDMMVQGYVAPNCFTFSGVLKACASLSDFGFGEQIHGQTIKLGLSEIDCVGNGLVSLYARSGRMEYARKCFDVLFEKNLVLYSGVVDDASMKDTNLNSGQDLDRGIDYAGSGASLFTYASLLSGAACIGTIGKGEQIHAMVVKMGFGTDLSVNNALISMYSKCGNKEAALQVFNDMEDRNVITWTSIINGFAKHGFAIKALELFYDMLQTGVKPNDVTYIAVLSACSHVGLIDEAWKHFTSMRNDHGIVPRMEHYACMVDLFGRSGLLSEAIEFINSMPFDADALVWRTFLGSCRVHGNTELGEHAAKMILEREPHDPATYILLSNLYASEGRWDDVSTIRKNMKQKQITKEAGSSWIEVENQVHKFHVGDTLHPKAQKIYEKLDELALKIKSVGYVPNTDFVLHDVEDEQKEQYLFQHSEKLAVAFALISTPNSKPIRVFKNLRVCGDCHSAIKYISTVTGREIVVRDANRFHHIKDGKCSCNDYW